jgi:hypothetical protein
MLDRYDCPRLAAAGDHLEAIDAERLVLRAGVLDHPLKVTALRCGYSGRGVSAAGQRKTSHRINRFNAATLMQLEHSAASFATMT